MLPRYLFRMGIFLFSVHLSICFDRNIKKVLASSKDNLFSYLGFRVFFLSVYNFSASKTSWTEFLYSIQQHSPHCRRFLDGLHKARGWAKTTVINVFAILFVVVIFGQTDRPEERWFYNLGFSCISAMCLIGSYKTLE